MNRHLYTATFTAVLVLISTPVHSQIFNARQGDIWLGGSMGFSSIGRSNSNSRRVNTLYVSPMIRFFPAQHLVAGPKFTWTGTYYNSEKYNTLGFGGEIGFAFGSGTIPYILVSPQFGTIIVDSYSEEAFIFPLTAGIIVPVGGNLGLQFEVGYTLNRYKDSNPTNVFSIGIGVCGLGKKLAVSVLNNIASTSSVF